MLMLGKKPVSPLCMPYAGIEKATNCLLEVPQNLKLELNGNVLTIKKGSVGVVCTSTYTTVTVANDVTLTLSQADGTYVIFLIGSGSGLVATPINKVSSGSSLPETGLNGDRFFNTTDTHMYYHNEAEWLASILCYPVCLIQITSGVASFVKDSNGNDMIFNGACFVGHHAVVYPNVKGLGGSGITSISLTNTSVTIIELTTNGNSCFLYQNFVIGPRNYLGEFDSISDIDTTGQAGIKLAYLKSKNYIIWNNTGSTWTPQTGNNTHCLLLQYSYSGGVVTDFAIQQPLTKYRWVVKLIP